MDHASVKSHPDQSLFDACQVWRQKDAEFHYATTDEEMNRVGDATHSALEVVASLPATTPEGLVAKAQVILEDDVNDLLNENHASEKLLKSVIVELVGLLGPTAPQPDQKLIDLCRRCVEALAANDAIYEAVPRGKDISNAVSDRASAHYEKEVVPLLKEIEATPTATLAGFVAKARVFMHDGVQFGGGEDDICNACAVMLNDLSGLDLVPEVPEAPHHYSVVRSGSLQATTQEAA